MENWGLMVFKESLLLIDPDNFTVQTRNEVALVGLYFSYLSSVKF
jgi:aminopeptidase N